MEHTLPMWRHYADLLINTGLEQIGATRHAGLEQDVEGTARALESFDAYYQRAFKIIQLFSIIPTEIHGRAAEVNTGTGCCITKHTYDKANSYAMFGPQGSGFRCETELHVGCGRSNSWEQVVDEAQNRDHLMGYLWSQRFKNIRKWEVYHYYTTQFTVSVDRWMDVRYHLLQQLET